MPRKPDLRRVDEVAREFGLDRIAFGDYLHRCKESGDYGSGPRGDYTVDELRQKAQELRDQQRS